MRVTGNRLDRHVSESELTSGQDWIGWTSGLPVDSDVTASLSTTTDNSYLILLR